MRLTCPIRKVPKNDKIESEKPETITSEPRVQSLYFREFLETQRFRPLRFGKMIRQCCSREMWLLQLFVTAMFTVTKIELR